MLRSLPENLLTYTLEGILIRARYVRQFDKIHKAEIAAKHATKKMLRDFTDKLEVHHKEVINHAYSDGLQALLGDILRFSAQYQEKLTQYEFKQREQITTTLAQLFESPEIQSKLVQRLLATTPSEKKITLEIPATLHRYLEKELNNPNIELITHNSKKIALHAGDQVTFFDPALLINDLKNQFHSPFSERGKTVFTQEIKETLIKFINTFDVLEDIPSQLEMPSEDNHED
ncbi:type III secretion protein [Proteus sp. FME41]|uniref:type III secretion protein n=1 Tax=Proteus sp. FME41 TaxID=2742608 RepID=UPI0018690326|nr:type III secretion protein [Proteus sp. FME41]